MAGMYKWDMQLSCHFLGINHCEELTLGVHNLWTPTINIFNQFNQQNNQVQGITIEDAVAIVQEENSKSLDPKKEVKYLESNYGMDDLPEVVATKQKGINTSKEGLTLNNKELSSIIEHYTKDIDKDKPDHNNRREKELSIDDDSIDPELNIY